MDGLTMKSKYSYTSYKGKKTSSKSNVVPNEAMTVRQMLVKNANGTLYDNLKTPYYEEQATFSTKPLNIIQNMSEMEKMDYLTEVTNSAQSLKAEIKTEVDRKIQEAQKLELETQRRNPVQTPPTDTAT